MVKRSDLSGFHKLSVKKRLKVIKDLAGLSEDEIKLLKNTGSLHMDTADRMIENAIGVVQLPLGIATNFKINDRDYLIPMAIEEPSVIAAASNAAKLARFSGGFSADCDESIMIGQIQLVGIDKKNIEGAKKNILSNKNKIREICNNKDSVMVKLGGGIKDIELRTINTMRGMMLIVHLIVDVKDAMGANSINTMAEAISPFLEDITGGKSRLKIISNLAIKRTVRSKAVWSRKVLGDELIEGILDAYAFAVADPFRCATHNKGVMNGIDAVMIATGNDFRATEVGAHSFAAYNKKYSPLTKFYKNNNGDLVGEIELPLAVGLVGGATRIHPIAKISLKILDIRGAAELSQIAASVGLANNFAAMRAMILEGIQKGHMKLHAHNIAATAGAKPDEVDIIAKRMIRDNNVSVSYAIHLIKEFKHEKRKNLIKKVEKRLRKKIKKRS